MWFEGEVNLIDFPVLFKKLMTTPDPLTGVPLWTEVSSNPGSSLNDDGYVFYSKGSSNKDNIFINLKLAFDGSWSNGYRIGVCEDYIPGSPGGNGIFNNEVYDSTYILYDVYPSSPSFTSAYGFSSSTYVIRYSMSITKDRVVISLRNNYLGINQHFSNPYYAYLDVHLRNVIYLGLIKRYSEEKDSNASVVATSYSKNNDSPGYIRALRNGGGVPGSYYSSTYNASYRSRRGWGGKFPTSPVILSTSGEGYRGELDGLLISSYGVDTRGANLPLFGKVKVDGKDYLCVSRASSRGYHLTSNSFGSSINSEYSLLIEIK